MPQIINANPSLGALFGSGISSGLEQLAQSRLQEMQGRSQRAQASRGLEALGFSPQQAHSVAGLPEKVQLAVINDYLQKVGQGEEFTPESGLSALQSFEQPAPQAQALMDQNFYKQAAPTQQPGMAALQNQKAAEKGLGKITPVQQQLQQQPQPQLQSPTKEPSLKETLARPTRAETAKQQAAIDKETKPVYDEITKEAKAARDNNKRLSRMEELVNRGRLTPAIIGSALDVLSHGIGGYVKIDLHALTDPDSQEFRKLSNDFVKSAKDIFGARLTQGEVNTFLTTVPSLIQTDEGKRRVITNMRSFNEAALARKKVADEVIKENGGRRPANFEMIVEERLSPVLDALADAFKRGSSTEEKPSAPNWYDYITPPLLGLLLGNLKL